MSVEVGSLTLFFDFVRARCHCGRRFRLNSEVRQRIHGAGATAHAAVAPRARRRVCGTGDQAKCCTALGTTYDIVVDKARTRSIRRSSAIGCSTQERPRFAANGGVKYHPLDNEPDHWQGLRRDIDAALYRARNELRVSRRDEWSIGKMLRSGYQSSHCRLRSA